MQYAFLEFVLDARARVLTHRGQSVALEPKVFDLLSLLVVHRERVVHKAELMEQLWPGTHVSDAALARLVKEARRAVADSGESQQVIRTSRGRGLRFVAALIEVPVSQGGFAQLWCDVGTALRNSRLAPPNECADEWLAWAATHSEPGQQAQVRDGVTRIVARALAEGDAELLTRAALALTSDHGALRPPELTTSELLRRAAQMLPPDALELRARLRIRLAAEHCLDGDLNVRAEVRAAALADVRGHPEPSVLRSALLCTRAQITELVGVDERRRWADVCAAAARTDTDELVGQLLIAEADFAAGKMAEIAVVRRTLLELAGRALDARLAWRVFRRCVSHSILCGHFDQAQGLLAEASRLAPAVDGSMEGLVVQRLTLAAERGVEGPTTSLDMQLVRQVSSFSAQCLYAWCAFELGHHDVATAALGDIVRRNLGGLAHVDNAVANAAVLANLAHAFGWQHMVRPLQTVLEPRIGTFAERATNAYHGPVERYLGLLAALDGQTSRAIDYFETSLETLRRAGARPWCARVGVELAAVLGPAGETARAEGLCEEAALEGRTFGMPRLVERARKTLEELRRT